MIKKEIENGNEIRPILKTFFLDFESLFSYLQETGSLV